MGVSGLGSTVGPVSGHPEGLNVSGRVGVTLSSIYKSGHIWPRSSGGRPAIIAGAPPAQARLTVGGGREDEGLAAVDADVAQVVEQRVVGGAAVAQGHQLLQKYEHHRLAPGRQEKGPPGLGGKGHCAV